MRRFTRRFAHHGYMAICANLYERAGKGHPDDVAAKVRAEGGIPDAQAIGGPAEARVRDLRGGDELVRVFEEIEMRRRRDAENHEWIRHHDERINDVGAQRRYRPLPAPPGEAGGARLRVCIAKRVPGAGSMRTGKPL